MKLVDLHNWFVDKEFLWWPFSFLKPEAHEKMTFARTTKMTLFFGGATFLLFLFLSIVNNTFVLTEEFYRFVLFFSMFGVWFNFITKPLWNIRAKKLKKI